MEIEILNRKSIGLKILLELYRKEEDFGIRLARKTKTTYCGVLTTIKRFLDCGLVEYSKSRERSRKNIKLTKKGRELAGKIENLRGKLNGN